METKPLLRDELTDRLREFVLDRQSNVPVRIAAERSLAETLGVSRISVRYALKALVTEGLLTQRQGSGTYIVPLGGLTAINVLIAKDIKRNDPFFNEFLAAMTHYSTERSVSLRLIREDTLTKADLGRAPTVLVGLLRDDTIRLIRQSPETAVSTQYYPDTLEITQVFFDDHQIGRGAADLLHENGHRSAIHLAGPRTYHSAYERTSGFIRGADRHGMKVVTLSGKMNWRSGYELGNEVVELLDGPQAPTAVFASNDWMALGLMHRLAEDRVAVPGVLSIIGCDDIHMADEVSPGLATFRWDMDLLVRELMSTIAAAQTSGEQSQKRVLLPARFVTRESLGPVPA